MISNMNDQRQAARSGWLIPLVAGTLAIALPAALKALAGGDGPGISNWLALAYLFVGVSAIKIAAIEVRFSRDRSRRLFCWAVVAADLVFAVAQAIQLLKH